MIYLAVGDSISIDDYTGVEHGGAVHQFARLLDVSSLVDLTADGCTTAGVLERLPQVSRRPNIITLTAGGNDLLQMSWWESKAEPELSKLLTSPRNTRPTAEKPLENLRLIARSLAEYGCPVIFNTVYDPTDGDDTLAGDLGLSPDFRVVFNELNRGIVSLAKEYGFLVSDLETLFHGHGLRSSDCWFEMQIEPGYAGATAIAAHWLKLFRQWQDAHSKP